MPFMKKSYIFISKQFAVVAFLLVLLISLTHAQAQHVYNPKANAEKELSEVIEKASQENKRVLITVGGNWCEWCVKFYHYCKNDTALDSLIKANYVELKINHSKENKNEAVLTKLDRPDKLGFPVFVILDKSGTRVHTQESGSLFGEKDWNREKIVSFLSTWAK